MTKKLNCILLIDDDDAINFLHRRMIEKADIAEHIQVAESGLEALDYLGNRGAFEDRIHYPHPDLIFLDINMPVMNGWDFLAEYEKLPAEQKGRIICVMLTTSLNPDDRIRAKAFNAVSEFMNKPLRMEMLQQIMEEHFPEYLGRFPGM